MLLLLASGWVLAYGGVFFLGFGGSRWTSDMAINYYKTVLGVAAQLMAMVLLVGIGKTFLDDYYTRMSAGISLKEMGVMLIVVIILWRWSTRFRPLIAGIITGASVGGAGIGQFRCRRCVGCRWHGSSSGRNRRRRSGRRRGLGRRWCSAVMAAFSKANENVESATAADDLMSAFTGGGGARGGGDGGGGDAWCTPFAQAAGFGWRWRWQWR
jgi:type IV secretion system protein TrbL